MYHNDEILEWHPNVKGFVYLRDVVNPDTSAVEEKRRALTYSLADGFAPEDSDSSNTNNGSITWTDFDNELISWSGSHRYTPPDAKGNVYRQGRAMIVAETHPNIVARYMAGAACIMITTEAVGDTPATSVRKLVVFTWHPVLAKLYCAFFENGELIVERLVVDGSVTGAAYYQLAKIVQHVAINKECTEAACIFKRGAINATYKDATTIVTWSIDLADNTVTVLSSVEQLLDIPVVTTTHNTRQWVTEPRSMGYYPPAWMLSGEDYYLSVTPATSRVLAVDYTKTGYIEYKITVEGTHRQGIRLTPTSDYPAPWSESIAASLGLDMSSKPLPMPTASESGNFGAVSVWTVVDAFSEVNYSIKHTGVTLSEINIVSSDSYDSNVDTTVVLSRTAHRVDGIEPPAWAWSYNPTPHYSGVNRRPPENIKSSSPDTWEHRIVCDIDLRYDYFNYYTTTCTGSYDTYTYSSRNEVTVGSYTHSTDAITPTSKLRIHLDIEGSLWYSVFPSGKFSFNALAPNVALFNSYSDAIVQFNEISSMLEATGYGNTKYLDVIFSTPPTILQIAKDGTAVPNTIKKLKGIM